jgi:predicted nucleic acid-binding protein
MTLIVDASVAVKWFVNEDRAAAARQVLRAGSIAAPEFILLELYHSLWNLARRSQFLMRDIEPSIRRAREAFDTFARQEDLFQEASTFAQAYSQPIYDCLYIAHAQRERMTLITADEKQFAAARKAKISVELL